jgi:hypothetical protein
MQHYPSCTGVQRHGSAAEFGNSSVGLGGAPGKSGHTDKFDHCEGLCFEPNSESLFELAGADGIFFPAWARIRDERVIVVSRKVKAPLYVRFAWGNTRVSNLFNAAGLPVSSFSTLRP